MWLNSPLYGLANLLNKRAEVQKLWRANDKLKKVLVGKKEMLTVLIYTTYVRYPLSFSYSLKSLAVTVLQLRLHDKLLSFLRANNEEKSGLA
jgi:hypothetical protein